MCKSQRLIWLIGAILFTVTLFPLYGDTWMRSYGGSLNDGFSVVLPHPDGGYLAGGITRSFGEPNVDAYLVRLDAEGGVLWERTYGGPDEDNVYDMRLTPDGGCLLLGWTKSFGAGAWDYLLLRVDASGTLLWQKSYGTAASEYSYAIAELTDGNYILAGITHENISARGYDFLFLKVDPDGNLLGQWAYGGTAGDVLGDARETADGGWIACGWTYKAPSFKYAWLVVKFSAAGVVEWEETFGGSGFDRAESIRQTEDGGYLVSGSYGNTSGDVLSVVRLAPDGLFLWGSGYRINDASSHYDDTPSIQETPDGGAVLSARDYSSGSAYYNFMILKVLPGGSPEWWNLFGSTGDETPAWLSPAPDGGYIMAGGTRSFGSGGGYTDAWIVKTDAAGGVGNACPYEGAPTLYQYPAVGGPAGFTGSWATTTAAAGSPSAVAGTPTSSVNEQCRGCDRETHLPDASCRTTAAVLHGGEMIHHTGCAASEHWMSFNACADQSYVVVTSGLESLADTVLELYAPDCTTLLTQDDDGGGGAASRMRWSVSSAGTYHARVRQKDGSKGLDRAFDVHLSGDTGVCNLWVEAIGTSAGDKIADLRPTSDGGFVFAGTRADAGGGTGYVCIGKTDASGARLWELSFGDDSAPNQATSVVESKDGGFIAVGATTDTVTWRSDAWIARIDSAGNLLWLKAYGEANGDDEARRVAEFQDGSILVAGVRNNPDADSWDLWIFRTTPAGEIGMEVPGTWSIYLGETYANEEPSDMVLTGENSFLIVGRSYDSPWPSGRAQALVAGFSCSTWGASVARSAIYEAPPWYLHSALYGLTAAPDGTFWAVGEAEQGEDYEPGDLDALVVHLAADGWKMGQYLLQGAAWDQASAVAPWGDGKILVAGETQSFTAGTAGWYAVVDGTGAITLQEVIGGTVEDGIASIRTGVDGGVAMAGRTRSFGEGDADGLMMKIQPGLNAPTPWCAAFGPSTAVNAVTTLIETAGWPSSGWYFSYPMTTNLASIQTPVSIITTACGGQRPLEVSPPGAVQALRFADKTTLVWEDGSLNGADTFNLYAGDLEDLAAGTFGECLQQGIVLPTTTVDETVPAGDCRAYLVTGNNMLGEGPLGRDSAGILRINAQPCW